MVVGEDGSAMRVSPCAWFGHSLDEVKDLSYEVAGVTHNHLKGLKEAQATAVAIYWARCVIKRGDSFSNA